jgi:hypothetical protein
VVTVVTVKLILNAGKSDEQLMSTAKYVYNPVIPQDPQTRMIQKEKERKCAQGKKYMTRP